MEAHTETRWQPSGMQFAYACRVCRHGTDIGGDTCRKCLSEVQSGFEFDHIKYVVRQAKLDDEKIMLFGGQRGGGKIFHLEQALSAKCAQLKETEIDRDRWKSAALYYRDLYNKQKQEENIMKQYIGTKVVQAEPAFMLTGWREHCKVANQVLTEEQIADCKQSGWEFTDQQEGYRVRYEDGYESWSPKDVFEDAYRQTDAMNFGLAIEAMKKGERVARKGWNGKDMYVFLAYEADFVTDADISAFDQLEVEVGDMLIMKTAQNTFQPGWLASQADMLADDWYIVE